MRACRFTVFVWVTALCLQSCSATAPSTYQQIKIDMKALVGAAAMGPGDVFEVRVHQHGDLTGLFRVSQSGQIDFPLVGTVKVVGLTSSQIAQTLRKRLSNGYLKNPSVAVYVKELNSKKVFVLGQVNKPGTFIYEKNMNIVQAIAMAGGFTNLAQKNYAIVRRAGEKAPIPVPVEQIITEKSAQNFLLKPGDIIFVPEAVL
jgi:protein involved in polysaccharide export with SLBB domain